MSTESVSQYTETEEAPKHVVTCCTALKYYLCCYCCCANRIAPVPSEEAIQSIGSGSITSDVFAQREREREQEVLKSLFKFSSGGKLGRFAAIQEAKKAADARNKRRFKTAGIAGMVISSSVATSQANIKHTKGRKSFQDVGKMAKLGVKAAKTGKGNNESIEVLESSDESSSSSSEEEEEEEEEEVTKKKGWGLRSIGKLGFLRGSSPEKVKPKRKKTFKDAGKLTRVGVQASGKGKSQPRTRKSFKAVGKLTQMGVKGSKSAKDESSDSEDDSEESSSDDDEETPKKKGWGLKAIGKLGFLRSSSPEKKPAKGKKSFKDAGKLARVGVQASGKGSKPPRSRKSFKDVGKLTRVGVQASGKGSKPPRSRKSFKDVGKLTRVGVQASGKGKKQPRGRKSFKDAGKLTRVGVQASGKGKKKKRMDSVDETLVEEILNSNEAATKEEAVVEVRRRRTLKSVGKIIKLSAAAKEKRPKRKLFTFKSIGNLIRYGTRNSPSKERHPDDMNESDSSQEISSPVRKKKSFKVAGKLAKFGFGRNKVESFDDERRPSPVRKKKSFKVAGKLAKFGFGRNKVESSDEDEEEEKPHKRKGKSTGIMSFFRGSSPEKKKKGKKTFKDAGKLTRVGVQASGKAKKKRGIPLRQSFKMVSVKIKKVTSLGTSISESFKRKTDPTAVVKKKQKKTLKSVAKVSMLGALVSKFSKSAPTTSKLKTPWTFKRLGKAAKVGAAVQSTAKRSRKPAKKKKFSLKFLSRFIGATQDDRKEKCTCIRDSINSDIMICTCSDYFDTDDER